MSFRAIGEYAVPPAVRRIASPIILMVLVFYFYINGPLIFGTLWTATNFGQAFLVYLLLIIGALVVAGLPKPFGNKDILKPVRAPLWLLLQITVSGAEELFFRGALYKAGPIITSAVFAAFHAFVYQLTIFPLIVAFGAGYGFYYLYKITKDDYGLTINTAAHLAYNTALLGIFILGYIGGCFLFGGAC